MKLHTYTPQPMPLPSINFLHLTVSEIQPEQTFSGLPPTRPPAHLDTMGENNTPTALKGCGVKTEILTRMMHATPIPLPEIVSKFIVGQTI